MGSVHNTDSTFLPYDPSKIIGDATPQLPVPQPSGGGGGCGGLGSLIEVIIVAIIIINAPTLLPEIFSSGGAASGTAAVSASAGTLTTAAGTLTATGAAVAAGLGTLAAQTVGILGGWREGFDFKSIALAAIGGGVSSGLGTEIFGPSGAATASLGNKILHAALSNAITQTIGVATGLQPSFSWRSIAAAGIGAGVGHIVDNAIGGTLGTDFGGRVAKASLVGLSAGLATAAARGGRINVTQIATDAFGNALGGALADSMSSVGGNSSGSGASRYAQAVDAQDQYEGAAMRANWQAHIASNQDMEDMEMGAGMRQMQADRARANINDSARPYGSLGSGSYGLDAFDQPMRLRQAGRDEMLANPAASTQRNATIGEGESILLSLKRMGLNESDSRAAYGQLIRSGQITRGDFDQYGRSIVQEGRQLAFDSANFNDADRKLAGQFIGREGNNRLWLAQEQTRADAQMKAAEAQAATNGNWITSTINLDAAVNHTPALAPTFTSSMPGGAMNTYSLGGGGTIKQLLFCKL